MTVTRVLGLTAAILAASRADGSSAVVGSFTQGNGATQQVTHALGQQPRAAIFWASGSTSTGTVARSAYPMVGFTDGTAGYVSGMTAVDNQTVSFAARAIARALITFDTATNTALSRATLSSWDASTFTLAWSPNDGLPRQLHYLLIGGTDVSARAIDFITMPTLGAFPVAGVGFKPDMLISIYAAFASTGLPSYGPALHSHLSAAGPGAEWSMGLNVQTAGFANRYFAPSALFVTQTTPPGLTANVASFDNDGFTLNVTRSTGTVRIMTLCLAGPGLAVGVLAAPPAGTQQVVGGLAFSPQTVFATTAFLPGSEMPATPARFSIGAASHSQTVATALGAVASPLPTSVTSLYDATTLLAEAATPAVTARLLGFSADGFTLQWSGTDGGAITVGYLAFGQGDAGPSDAGPSDAGPSDAGPSDAGPSDAGPSDAGPSDAGPSDGGTMEPRQLHVACGCAGTPFGLWLVLAAVPLLRAATRGAS